MTQVWSGSRLQVAVLCALLVGAWALPSGCDQKKRNESIQLTNHGLNALADGDTETAYSMFRRATRVDPKNHRALYELALVDIYDNEERQRGMASLEAAEKIQPEDRDVLYQLGRNYIENDEVDRGLRYLERTLVLDKFYAPALYQRGVGLLKKDDFDGADAAFRGAIAANHEYASAYRDLGEMYERFGHDAAARTVYEAGATHAEGTSDLHNSLGLLAMRSGEVDKAIDYFSSARSSGGRTDTAFNLANAYVEKGDIRQAYRYLGEFVNSADPSQKESIQVAMRLRASMMDRMNAEKDREQDKPNDTPDAP